MIIIITPRYDNQNYRSIRAQIECNWQIIKQKNLSIETRIGETFKILITNHYGKVIKEIEQPSISLIFDNI
jgi:hypothetical protein